MAGQLCASAVLAPKAAASRVTSVTCLRVISFSVDYSWGRRLPTAIITRIAEVAYASPGWRMGGIYPLNREMIVVD
ncbi:hypothetical protein GCM10027317_18130 [Massilia agri]